MFYTKKTVDALVEQLTERSNALDHSIGSLRSELPSIIKEAIEQHELSKAVAQQKTADERQASDIPFIEVIADGYDPEHGIQMQLDWNAAFIKELKAKGYRGRSERDMVNKWLAATHKQLAEQMEQADKI